MPPSTDPGDAGGDPRDEEVLGSLETSAAEHASRPELDIALHDIDRSLTSVGTLVSDAIAPMTEAFLTGDALTAQRLVAEDRKVDLACRDLEERCFTLMARQAPVAADLRHIVAVLRCTNHVLRSGDLLRHVGESLKWIHPPSLPAKLRETVAQLGEVTDDLFGRGLDSWRTKDALVAVELDADDDQVDLLQKVLLTDLYTGDQGVEDAVSLALIARYYERIADHAVELARQAAYVVTGDPPPAGSG